MSLCVIFFTHDNRSHVHYTSFRDHFVYYNFIVKQPWQTPHLLSFLRKSTILTCRRKLMTSVGLNCCCDTVLRSAHGCLRANMKYTVQAAAHISTLGPFTQRHASGDMYSGVIPLGEKGSVDSRTVPKSIRYIRVPSSLQPQLSAVKRKLKRNDGYKANWLG